MVFPSVPVYLDPPNWHHQQQSDLQPENVAANSQLQLPPLPPPSYGNGGGGSGPGSIKPGSMSDRARQAKLQPETVLKCPRCESTNTKFCYFNNYNLSQPRHFCKTCRRYWTRGGALRNVPVGGGCRRNKKSKNSSTSSSSSSPSKSQATGTIVSSSSTPPRDHSLMGHHFPQQPPQLPFLSSLQNLSQLSSLNLRGIGSVSVNNSILSADQWSSVQQFPFLPGGFDQSSAGNYNLFSFQNGAATAAAAATSTRVCDQMKMEETLNSGTGRQFLGISDNNNSNNNEYYSSWNSSTDQLTGQQLSSSSLATTHFL